LQALTVCAVVSMILAGVAAGEQAVSELDDAALIVIDIQEFYFPDGAVPLTKPELAAKRAARVIDAFRSANRPVIHVQHLPEGDS
jgi:nicotinamidase-related amidase